MTHSNDYATALRDHLHQLGDFDAEATTYRDHGTLRTVEPLTDDERSRINALRNQFDTAVKQCYKNAQLLASADDSLTYVEGVTISADVPIPIKHAWVELHGKVCEVTMPEAPETKTDATYLGVPYSTATIRTALDEREQASPLAPDYTTIADDDQEDAR